MSFEPLDIDDAFDAFMRKVYPGVPETSEQYRESRRIWFAGMSILFLHIMVASTLPGKKAEAELTNLRTQLTSFSKDRVAGDKD